MIYCVWYPSGGFGHFINAILTMYGHNFVRPSGHLCFSATGDSHSVDLVVPKYYRNTWVQNFDFESDKNYSVLIDNGINDEGEQFRQVFVNAPVIKICYSDHTWPIVAHTMIVKAMQRDLDQELPATAWHSKESWAQREKYFLYLRDHALRHCWKANHKDHNLLIDHMTDYHILHHKINDFVDVGNFATEWTNWRTANSRYIDPVSTAQKVIDAVQYGKLLVLDKITDVWTQAVVYYFIWLHYGIEVPHNDFANFFAHTDQIRELVQ